MTSRDVVTESSVICPACSTRLRISPLQAVIPNFHCPECDTALAADRGADQTVVLRVIPVERSDRDSRVSLLQHARSGNSRLIAFVVAASVGMVTLILTVPSVESEGHQRLHVNVDSEAGSTAGRNVTASDNASVSMPPVSDQGSKGHRRQFSDAAADHLVLDTVSGTNRSGTPTVHPAGKSSPSQAVQNDGASDARLLTGREAAGGPPITKPPQSGVLPEREPFPVPEKPAEVSADATSVETTGVESTRVESMRWSLRLKIPIQSFRVTEPLSVRKVVELVEQMCRVEVGTSSVADGKLDRRVTLILQETTPVEILSEAARKSGLRVIVDETSVRLVAGDG